MTGTLQSILGCQKKHQSQLGCFNLLKNGSSVFVRGESDVPRGARHTFRSRQLASPACDSGEIQGTTAKKKREGKKVAAKDRRVDIK